MNERPTPETYAFFYSNGYPVEIDSSKAMQLCEKLEQERDEARELLESEKITRNHIMQSGIKMQQELWRTCTRLLAEAREQEKIHLDKIRRLEKQIEGLNNAANERFEEIERVRNERNKAREDVRTLQDIKRKHEHEELVAAQENDRLKIERDDAREQLRLANIDCFAALTELDAAREKIAELLGKEGAK